MCVCVCFAGGQTRLHTCYARPTEPRPSLLGFISIAKYVIAGVYSVSFELSVWLLLLLMTILGSSSVNMF